MISSRKNPREIGDFYCSMFLILFFSVWSEEEWKVPKEYDEKERSPYTSANHRSFVVVVSFCDDSRTSFSLTFLYFFWSASFLYCLSWDLISIRTSNRIFTSLDLIAMSASHIFIISDDHPLDPIVSDISISDDRTYETDDGCECEIESKYRESFHIKKDRK